MKQFITLLWILSSTTLLAQRISVKGSDTMLPLVTELAAQYMNEHAEETVAVSGGGSMYGVEGLQNGSAQIAMCSRTLTSQETSTLSQVKQTVVAYDALSIIVNPGNLINRLTQQQLMLIFTGAITNWKELGGADLAITVITRDQKSGTFGFIKKQVLQGKSVCSTATTMYSNESILDKVSTTKGAIGYVGLAYLEDIVKALAVSFNGSNYVKPTFKNALEKKYPIMRPLYYYYTEADKPKLKEFREFTLSSKGQQAASYAGYIPVKF